MPRKSKWRTMATSRWLRWALLRSVCLAFPPLARALNFPLRAVRAIDIADRVLEHAVSELTFSDAAGPVVDEVLRAAMANDAGYTSTYPQRRSPFSCIAATLSDCMIYGRTLTVMHGPDAALVSRETYAPNWNQAKPEWLRTIPAQDGLHYVTTSGGHYFHFFANDILPLLNVWHRFGKQLGTIRVVVREGSPAYVEATLAAIQRQIPEIHICKLGARERLNHVRTLFVSQSADTLEWMPATRAEADEFATLLIRYYGLSREEPRQHRKLFITRGDARLRRLTNEVDVARALDPLGFEMFEPLGGNHPEQVERFRTAHTVVAVHGAALTNLLFCRPGTRVIELFPGNHIKSTYCWLADRLGLDYQALPGTDGDLMQAFAVDARKVVEAVG